MTPDKNVLAARNPVCAVWDDIPAHGPASFYDTLAARMGAGARLVALFGVPGPDGVYAAAVLAVDQKGRIELCRLNPCASYPSITAAFPEAHALERNLWEKWGFIPEGHPWLKPLRKIDGESSPPGGHDYYRVEGEEIHEVAVGPVHAGIIEPGHFRFQCHGERVYHLEIRLGYQHRGARDFLLGGNSPRWAAVAESVSGDTAVGGALAHALCIEALSGFVPGPRADALRALVLEIERMAYHVGDLGALGNDVGFLPTAQYNGRIRGDFLNTLLTITGNRHGRGFVRPGGVLFDLDDSRKTDLLQRIRRHHGEARKSTDLLLNSPSVMARFENTGRISASDARTLGMVGLPARASGVMLDVRTDHPVGAYRFMQMPVSTGEHGDVHARALVRSLELDRSAEFALLLLDGLPRGQVMGKPGPLAPGRLAVAMVEAWRGELVHAKVTDEKGNVKAAEIVDPSVHNWFGLALCLRGEEISDFPLCNKSFNLAYAGHDL